MKWITRHANVILLVIFIMQIFMISFQVFELSRFDIVDDFLPTMAYPDRSNIESTLYSVITGVPIFSQFALSPFAILALYRMVAEKRQKAIWSLVFMLLVIVTLYLSWLLGVNYVINFD